MYATEVVSLMGSGAIKLPGSIRDAMRLQKGAKLVAVSDGTSVVLKPIEIPRAQMLARLLKQSHAYARKAGLKRRDVPRLIERVRRASRG